MLGTLKKIFNKADDSVTPESEQYEPEASSNPNFLTDPGKIQRLLKDIEEASPLCTINVEGITEEFSSSILDVQLDNQQIILDELIPKHGNDLLSENYKIKLSTIFNGIRLAFKLNIIASDSSKGIAYYKAKIPNRIYYPQRRTAPRISISSQNISFSGVANRTKTSMGGYVFDVSRGGIGIYSQVRPRAQRGDIIKDCKISLEEQVITFDLRIRFIKTISEGSGKTQVGGYFENISSKSQNKIEHFVASLEREEIRKRKN